MSDRVWISSMFGNSRLGDRPGLRCKFFGEEWDAAQFDLPVASQKLLGVFDRYGRGIAVDRDEMPEAAAVWNEKRFKQMGPLFAVRGFYVVRDKLAEVLSRFDLGEGGLIPFTIFQADMETPYPGEFWLLSFGCVKNTILPEQSENVVKRGVDINTGQELWKVNSWHEDDEVVLSPAALTGPDLWFEDVIYNRIFMSDALATALQEAGLADDWELKRCRIAGDAA